MAYHRAVRLVVGQRERTVRALYRLAAGRAADARVISPAVQQQYRLLAVFEVLPHFVDERHAERGVVPVLLFHAHVNDVDVRKYRVVVALVQLEQAVAPYFCVIVALQRRRCRSQKQERVMVKAPLLRDVPGVIPRGALGLVRPLAFLVDDDYAEVLHRGENRAPCPDHYMRPAGLYARVFVRALTQRKTAVEYRHVVAEQPPELSHHLRREGYLRDKHYRGLALLHGFVYQAYEHRGFAASGNSPQERAFRRVVVHQLQQAIEHALLLRRKHDIRRAFGLPLGILQAEHLVLVLLKQPLPDQPLNYRGGDVQRVAHLVHRSRAVFLQEFQHLLLLRGELWRLRAFGQLREFHHQRGFVADPAFQQLGFLYRAGVFQRFQQLLVLGLGAVLLAKLRNAGQQRLLPGGQRPRKSVYRLVAGLERVAQPRREYRAERVKIRAERVVAYPFA